MLVSFYISRNDLDQLNKLESINGIFDKEDLYTIDAISSIDDNDVEAIKKWFVQVSIDYKVYLKIQDYLNFELFERYKKTAY
jgi:hypothetical protein